MSTLPIPPLTALPPASNAANTSLRWTAHRHHESLQTFLRTNSTLSQELEELRSSKNTLTHDDAASMVAEVRDEMKKTVGALNLQLEDCRTRLSRHKGELDVKDLKIAELQGSNASSSAILMAEIEGLRRKVGEVESENASLRSERGDRNGDIERFRILNEELELENQVGPPSFLDWFDLSSWHVAHSRFPALPASVSMRVTQRNKQQSRHWRRHSTT